MKLTLLCFIFFSAFGAIYSTTSYAEDTSYLIRNGNLIHCTDGKNIRFEINPKRTMVKYFMYDHVIVQKRIIDKINLEPFSVILETKSEKFHFTNIGSRLELDQDSDLIELFCY
jgi:hypothetical protein